MKIEEIDDNTLRVELEAKLNWQYEKFKGDMAIYAICPFCNFTHQVGEKDFKTGELNISQQYVFCPMCGSFLYSEGEADCTYNERDITDLYKIKYNTEVITNAINECNAYYQEDNEDDNEQSN